MPHHSALGANHYIDAKVYDCPFCDRRNGAVETNSVGPTMHLDLPHSFGTTLAWTAQY